MIDDILEVVLEVLLEGAIELTGGKKKAAIIAIAALVWFALSVLFLWVGISEKDMGLIIAGAVLLMALGVWLYIKVKRYRGKER